MLLQVSVDQCIYFYMNITKERYHQDMSKKALWKKILQYLAKNDNGLSFLAFIPHFRALFLSLLGTLVF